MVSIIAGSSNKLIYYTKVNGVSTQLSGAPTLTITNGSGVDVSYADTVTWDSDVGGYVVWLEPGEVSVTETGEVWELAWSWEYSGQTLRDVERAAIVSTGLKDLTLMLRKRIKDLGTVRIDYALGDGQSSEFGLEFSPVKPSSVQVYIDSVQTTGFGVMAEDGYVVFTSGNTPASGEKIKVIYTSYNYTEDELETFVVEGLIRSNTDLSTSFSLTDPTLTSEQKSNVILFALREFYANEMLNSAPSSFSWKDSEKSITKSGLTSNYVWALKLIDEKIDKMVREAKFASTGYVRSGGGEPVNYNTVDFDSAGV